MTGLRLGIAWLFLALAGCGGTQGGGAQAPQDASHDGAPDLVDAAPQDDMETPDDAATQEDAEAPPDDAGEADGMDAQDLDVAEVPRLDAPDWGPRRSWVLLSADPARVAQNLERASEFGVEEVQLSHELISAIDRLGSEERQPVLEALAQAKARGLRVLVWSNELNNVPFALCFDPADPVWAARKQAYRDAFAVAPQLDGVVLSFGSASPPPWLAACTCAWCQEIESDAPASVRAFRVPEPAERVRFLVELVHDVVTGELGRQVYVRTFIHEPDELAWVLDGLGRVPAWRRLTVMSKDVPNDWEPYYPLDPSFGAFPDRPTIMEFDAAGEYWGVGELPFPAVGYVERRIRGARAGRLDGYAARVERGGRSALDTPNEVNLYALARFFDDEEATPAQVWSEWIERRYGVSPSDPRSAALAQVHDRAFDVGRKMYYQLGFWGLEKGSNLPEACAAPPQFEARRIDKWDPAYGPLYERLAHPDAQTLADLRQEDLEALELAEQNVAEVDALIEGGLDTPELRDLRRRLAKQRDAAPIWMELVEALWGRKLYEQTEDPLHAAWVLGAADRFEQAARVYAERWAGDLAPVSPERAGPCAAQLRRRLPEVAAQARAWPRLDAPVARVEGGELVVVVRSQEPARFSLSLGEALPNLPTQVQREEAATEATLRAPWPEGDPLWVVFQVRAQREDGVVVQGSDYWVRRP